MLSRADEPVPILLNVLRRAADLGDDHRDVFGGNHLDGIPRANKQLVRVRLLAGDVDADFATDAALKVDLAPLLRALDNAAIDRLQLDAIHRADFQAGLAAGAIVGVDDREFFGDFFAGSSFGHGLLKVGLEVAVGVARRRAVSPRLRR